MRNAHRWIGFIFVALLSVYSGWAGQAKADDASPPATQPAPTQLAQATDPFSASTQPSDQKPAAKPQITVSDAGTFSIQINNDVSLAEVLRMIGSQAQVSIIPSKELHGVTVSAMDLYNVTVNEALDAILQSNGFTYEQKGNIIYVYSDKEMQERKKLRVETNVYRLYYISAQDALTLVKPILSPEATTSVTPAAATGASGSSAGGGSSSGGSSGGTSSGGSTGGAGGGSSGGNSYANVDLLVITDHPENQEKVRQVIKEIDRRPKQILVEATILESELTENNQLGVNFTALGSINFSDLGVLPFGAPTVLTSNPNASSSSGSGGSSSGSSSGLGNVPAGAANKGFNVVQTGTNGLQIGILQDDIGIFLTALEAVTNTTVLSNPKVLTLDKQQGEVHIGETIYYEGSQTSTATTTTTNATSLNTGIDLTFRPYIGDDGYIRMDINPSDSTPEGTGNPTLGLPPNINENEVSANIMVKDGHTVLIGGLFQDNSSTATSQVPFFGDLPFAGALFRQTADSTDRKEIIFLLTPHIVKDENAFSDMTEQQLKDMEKLRVGVRQGMMPWGRERLAESCYEEAETELHKPNPDLNMVRWHLDCATNLNPQFLEAIELKEKLTGQVLTTSDNSSIRGFVRRLMLADEQNGVRLEEAPPKTVKISSAPPATQPAQAQPSPAEPTVSELPTTRPASASAAAQSTSDDDQP
jgi:type IV pilus assembly protein PilQ